MIEVTSIHGPGFRDYDRFEDVEEDAMVNFVLDKLHDGAVVTIRRYDPMTTPA